MSLRPTYLEVLADYSARERATADPTTLLVIDEADRLRITSLEQVRAIFDEGTAGNGPHRHAGNREADGTLSSILFMDRLRS
jgi:hypothetical protein